MIPWKMDALFSSRPFCIVLFGAERYGRVASDLAAAGTGKKILGVSGKKATSHAREPAAPCCMRARHMERPWQE